MRPRRLLLTALLTAALVPGTWLRTPLPPPDRDPLVLIEPLDAGHPKAGPFRLEEAWQLTGDQTRFGGLSALVYLGDGRFLAGSDGGRKLVFERPDRSAGSGMLSRFGPQEPGDKMSADLEALTRDPDTGTIWGSYEVSNAIVRFNRRLEAVGRVRPAAMRDWGGNSGAEAFARLGDGRFVAIAEEATEWAGRHHRALLLPGDPLAREEAEEFGFIGPEQYRPVDMTPLSQGRALVLFRKLLWTVPPGFETAIGLVDFDQRDPQGDVRVQMLARLDSRFLPDNYEGIAVTRDADGRHVWLISDDNFAAFQRTLLLKLRWDGREKARD